MRNPFVIAAGLIVLASVVSCQKKIQEIPAGKPLTLENRTIRQEKGTDCDTRNPEDRTDCAIIDFTVPKLGGAEAQSSVGKSLDAWVDKTLIRFLIWSDYPEADPSKDLAKLDDAISRFREIHDEAAGSVSSGMFRAGSTYDELLNDGKYLTLAIDGRSYVGGNRPLNEVAIATFDVSTGKQLVWNDLVKDKNSLTTMAQQKVRETRADVFREGFEFDTTEPFALPASYGLTAEGLVLHYQSDEIYRLGGATEFTIPYSELGNNLLVKAPAAPAAGEPAEDVSGLYETAGDSLVIPAFEIEVRMSDKAAAAMKKKKETVIVAAYFSGEPKNIRDSEEDGSMSILRSEVELTGADRIARFEGLKFSRRQLNKLADKDIRLLINLFSGRKSSEDNLLNCNLIDLQSSQFGGKRFSIGCSLIEESSDGSMPPVAAFALPGQGEAASAPLPLVVDCSEQGEISFAGVPVKDMEELKSVLRPVLTDLLKTGYKTIPGIKTTGCMMGMQGAIRDAYDEVKKEMKPAKTSTGKTVPEEQTKGTGTPVKTTKKSPSAPSVTVNGKGEVTLDGKSVPMDNLRKELQEKLLGYAVIPDKVEVKTSGEVLMGTRGEVNTIAGEAVSGAKWVRKKAALDALGNSVGKKLGTAVNLEVNHYRTSGSFAFLDVKPRLIDGKAIDYSKTPYKEEVASGKFTDRTVGLLQYDKNAWKVLAFNIGAGAVPVDAWVKSYKAPKEMFGKGG